MSHLWLESEEEYSGKLINLIPYLHFVPIRVFHFPVASINIISPKLESNSVLGILLALSQAFSLSLKVFSHKNSESIIILSLVLNVPKQ